jgi:hypothetical protein
MIVKKTSVTYADGVRTWEGMVGPNDYVWITDQVEYPEYGPLDMSHFKIEKKKFSRLSRDNKVGLLHSNPLDAKQFIKGHIVRQNMRSSRYESKSMVKVLDLLEAAKGGGVTYMGEKHCNHMSETSSSESKFFSDVKSLLDRWNRRKTQSGMGRDVQHPWHRGGWAMDLAKIVREYEKTKG